MAFQAADSERDELGNVVGMASRRPGRPAGQKKTGGRKPGSKNKRTLEVEEAMRPVLPAAKRKLRALIESEDQEIAMKAVTMVYGYVFGKPRESRVVLGGDGGPAAQQMIEEQAARIAAAFGDAADAPDPGTVLPDEALRAVQAVNFARELAKRARKPAIESPAPVAPVPAVTEPETPSARPARVHSDAEASNPEPAEPTAPDVGYRIRFMDLDWEIVGHAPDRDGLPVVYEARLRGQMVRRGPFEVVLKLIADKSGGLGPWLLQAPPKMTEPGRPDQRPVGGMARPAVHRQQPRRR